MMSLTMWSGGDLPDFTWLFYFAMFGVVCAAVACVGGIGWLIWFIVNHVAIV